jgi:antibiotic biosynthesis monooxygenase (ABM) superfamily enzyme
MTASNVVRFRVKPGQEKEFVRLHEEMFREGQPGGSEAFLIQTGEREFCIVGKWDSMDALAAARPTMIGMLDRFRSMLEDLGNGLGVTDPVSGEIVAQTSASQGQRPTA